MPELAEVEYYRRQWDGGVGGRVERVELHSKKRIFRGANAALIKQTLAGARLLNSEARGKQMVFRFSKDAWLGIHLGMSGKLSVEAAHFSPGKHDHLVLFQKKRALIFADARMFGRVRFSIGKSEPVWWSALPPALTSAEFTRAVLRARLTRARRAPIKAVLLDQSAFPGVGNWMADEILWQAGLHPAMPAGDLNDAKQQALFAKTRAICRIALKTIGATWDDPPKNWLIHVRWKKGGHCPRDGKPLKHATIGGRTTAWCHLCQKK